MTNQESGLKTIEQNGHVPATRMSDAQATQDYVRRLIQNDARRSQKRARVNGLVDGNPPYSAAKLRDAGRADAANFNSGNGRAYMESGSGSFYDLFSEAPGFVGIQTGYGTMEERIQYGQVMREEADRILSEDDVFDYTIQQSQWEMTLHGCGPLMFEDAHSVLPRSFHCGDLKVPEFTRSDTKYWDACAVMSNYYPPELYKFIKDEKAASAVGWDVKYTKNVIANAMGIKQQLGLRVDWEFYQAELKNNSLSYTNDDTKVIKLAHVFWKEFDERITHAIVEQDSTTATAEGTKYLYIRVGRYASWKECIHPMYFDRGNGGYHHSVTGLGVKMFSAMEYENRLMCNLADKAFAPDVLIKPTTTEASQKFSLAHLGPFAVLPGGFEWSQTGLSANLLNGLAMKNALAGQMRENLSSYRQGPMQKEGNPVTAKQVMYDASQQSSLSKTTFNRYYKQMDLLYTEVVRRLCDLNSPDAKAREFQDRCKKRGVPVECFGRIEKVEAIRVIGQGNSFMRKDAVASVGAVVQSLPEEGRDNWMTDFISANAGAAAAARYYPREATRKLSSDQQAEAMQWVAAMKTGVPPVVTSTQNPVVYATTFMQAAAQAVGTLEQGSNPMEVLHFIEICGPAIMAQLQRFKNDPTRAAAYKALEAQWKKLAKIADDLKKGVQKMAEHQRMQQEKTTQIMSDAELEQYQVQAEIELKKVKTLAQLEQSAAKHRQKLLQGAQQMAMADAVTASDIKNSRAKTASSIRQK